MRPDWKSNAPDERKKRQQVMAISRLIAAVSLLAAEPLMVVATRLRLISHWISATTDGWSTVPLLSGIISVLSEQQPGNTTKCGSHYF